MRSGYLPHRQLRKNTVPIPINILSYLPHRQLRKTDLSIELVRKCYLPHRQLRNAHGQSVFP